MAAALIINTKQQALDVEERGELFFVKKIL
jgi:hypothetical protein